MNKFYTKIASLLVGAAMAIGVGFAVGNNSRSAAKAATGLTQAVDYTDFTGGTQGSGSSISATCGVFTINLSKGYKNSTYTHNYANGVITFTGDSTVSKITGISITASSSSYNGAQSSGSWSVESGGGSVACNNTTITYSNGTASKVELKNSKQLRWTEMTITYDTASSQTVTAVSTPVAGNNFQKTYTDVDSTTQWSTTGLSATVTIQETGDYTGAITYNFNPATPLDYVTNGSTSLSITATAGGVTSTTPLVINDMSVTAKKGSQPSSAYTVADAITALNTSTPINGVYATGIVCGYANNQDGPTVPYVNNSGQLSFYFSATGALGQDGASANRLEAYKCYKSSDNTGFNTDCSDVPEIGDTVIVYGDLKKYTPNSGDVVYEFDQNCYVHSLTAGTINSISIKTAPTKVAYYENEYFDPTGLVITATMPNNVTKDVSYAKKASSFTFSPNTSTALTTSNTSITITYGGQSTTQAITVSAARTLESITLSGTYPASFEQGDTFSHAGMVVTANYDNSTTEDVTNDASWSSPDMTTTGQKEVTVTYGGKTAKYNITVTEHVAKKYGEYTGAIAAGQYVIVAADRATALTASISSNRFTNTNVTISSGIIQDPAASVVWTIEQVSGTNYWSIYNSSTSKYAAGTSSKNQGALLDSVVDLSKWTITYDNGYVFENYGRTIADSDQANAYLRQNSTESNGWATYAALTGKAPTLYKLNYLPKTWASFNYVDAMPDKTSYIVGESFDPTGLEIHAVYTEPSIHPEEDITDEIVWDALVEGTEATGTWDGHKVTITGLTISAYAAVTYTKLTSLDQLAVGSEVIIGGYKSSSTTYYALSAFSSNHFGATETTGTSSTLVTTSDTLIFTVEADCNGYYFKSGTNYIKRSNADSGFGAKDSDACWTISFGEEGAVTMENGNSGNTAFQFNDSSPRFKNYSGTQKDIFIYVRSAASETDILRTYASRYLLLENETLDQIPSSETGVVGTDCLGDSGPYMRAKAALNSGEFASHKSNFQSSSDSIVANARLRYVAWARAYGDTTPYAANATPANSLLIAQIGNNSSMIIVVISITSVLAIGGFFFLRKRKED